MNETEIKATFHTAQETLRSRSKFVLFCVELSQELYGTPQMGVGGPNDFMTLSNPALMEEYVMFWRLMAPFLQIQG